MTVNYNPRCTQDGLFLHLDAANIRSYSGTGTTWYDLSGNARNAVKAGSQSPTYPQYNTDGFFTFNGGIVANNYSRFDVANIPSFSALSVFVWYRASGTTDFSGNRSLLRMDNSDFELSVNKTNEFWVAAGTNFNDILATGALSSIADGNWHNMGLTFDGQNLKGFFDSRQVVSNTRGSPTTTAAGTLRIGTRDDLYAHHLYGDMAIISIYNKALSLDEIRQNFYAFKSRFEHVGSGSGGGGTGGGFG
jgi:hypothetical protein